MVEIVISAVVAAVATLMTSVTSRRQKREKEEEDNRRKVLNNTLRTTFDKSLQNYYTKYGSQPIHRDYIIKALRNSLVHYQSPEPKADMKEQANAIVDELKKRIEVMKARSTQENKSEKVSSVNDAILETRLRAMSDDKIRQAIAD